MQEARKLEEDPDYDKKLQVHDSSLDYKGRVPLRSSTGSWKAAAFIITIEFSERLSYFGIAANLISYMTKVMHQDLETAANSVNVWSGVTTVMPLLGAFLADAYTGRFFMILFSAILYVLGLVLLTMTQFIPSLKPCNSNDDQNSSCQHNNNVHYAVFFVGIYVVSLATGGYKPCLESFGADQYDDNHTKERKQKMSFFNWWNIALCAGLFLGVTFIVYLEDYVDWGVGFLTLAVTMALTVLVFVLGRPFYRYRTPQGSPFTPLLQVLVAALAKRNLPCPTDPTLLYEVPKQEKVEGQLLCHTDRFRFFDKAAIIEDNESGANKQGSWRLKTVTQVEEFKLILSMTPIWLTSLIFGVGMAQATTFFIKQGSTMNRRINSNFEIPPGSITALVALGMIISIVFYDKFLLPYRRRVTGNERGISILKRIGIGMVILIIAMVVSALVERKRLMASREGIILNVFWLAPQFLIVGFGDGFSLVGMQEYFYDQVPDSMRSLGMAFYLSVIGVGSFLSSLIIIIINEATGRNGGRKWIGKSLNQSRLDYYYWVLAGISVLNLGAFVLMTKNYKYKSVQRSVAMDDDSSEGEREEEMATK